MSKANSSGSGTLTQKVMKIMALFTGMQCITLLCAIIKTKLVALWLSTEGVGLFGILNSTLETTATLTDMGLRQSTVRDVAKSADSPAQLSRIAAVVRRWSSATGLLGAVVVSGLCVPLSLWFFGNTDRWWMFALLALAMICNAVTGGEQSLLQGSARFRHLLKANLWGTVGGLILSIPLFRWCGLTGVVWSVVLYGVCALSFTLMFRLKVPSVKKLTVRDVWLEGKGFMHLGALMAVAAFITNMAQMAFLAFLSESASLAEVGLYQGGVTLTVRYVGLIFTALSMEYYPRLSANIYSDRRTEVFVNHEATLILTLLVPILCIFILCRRWIVLLLYQPEFEAMIPFISWAVLSSVFKATSWCMAFVILAKGDGRTYILTESIDAVIGLLMCIAGYKLAGMRGIGFGYIIWYGFYVIIAWWVYTKRYGLHIRKSTIWLTILCFGCGVGALAVVTWMPYWFAMLLLGGVSIGSLPFIGRLWKKKKTEKKRLNCRC